MLFAIEVHDNFEARNEMRYYPICIIFKELLTSETVQELSVTHMTSDYVQNLSQNRIPAGDEYMRYWAYS